MSKMKNDEYPIPNGVDLIVAERKRQVFEKGCAPEHDDQHTGGEMALVAALLASPELLYKQARDRQGKLVFTDPWPENWDRRWDKRPYKDKNGRPNHDVNIGTHLRIQQLQKAGALIAAEIDRLLRIQAGVAKPLAEKSPLEL